MNDATPDYKQTILLPKTAFPMQAQLAKREPEALKRWIEQDLYAQVQQATSGRPPFVFVDGPPYANGDIHIGHAVNKVLKDIVVKAARLDGKQAALVPGWDCHGLPIEHQVEKKYGKVGDKLSAAEFRQKCRDYAAEQVARQREDFKRLGVLADWDHPYLTMLPAYEAEQLRALAQIIERGHVVRGFKPVHWCLDCASSLAEAEVEYQDKVSAAIDVRFVADNPDELARRFGVAAVPADAGFVIWTTTPWTLPANRAIAAGAELEYVLARFATVGTLVLAAALLEACAQRYGDAQPEILGRCSGAALEGLHARHPFAARTVPLVLGEHVTLDAGTGLVHTAPAHGVEDYQVGQHYALAVDNPVGNDGVFAAATPIVAGLHVRKAEEPILEALRANGALAHQARLTHSYPHCWRHKTPLIFRATPQWFISMDKQGLRTQALQAIRATRFIPEWGQERIYDMVRERPDWCISRQRYWGVPMAVFVDRATQSLHPRSAELLRGIADRVEAEGLEAWFGSQPADWLGAEAADFDKCTDTLDVWFDSGVAHQCSFKAVHPEWLQDGIAPQADIYLEGSDQHRGWFHSSLLTRVAMFGEAPYKTVLTHGFTVDEQGRKMSKSLGNVIAPQTVVKELGADVLRLWVAASDYRGEIAVSNELFKRIADAYRRIRNTVRYLLGSLHDFEPAAHAVPNAALLPLDAWALTQAGLLQGELQIAYRNADFHLIYQKLHNYCVVDLGGLYLDILKDRLYTLPQAHPARRSAQTVLWHLAEAMVRWIAPILSFTADEIWHLLPGERDVPVFAQSWYALPTQLERAAGIDWPRLLQAREGVKKALEALRVKGDIGSGLEADVRLYADGDMAAALAGLGEELRFWFLTGSTQLAAAAQRPATAEAAGDAEDLGLWLEVQASPHAKCQRCWHHRPDVGADPRHATLCARCASNISDAGAGEQRCYV